MTDYERGYEQGKADATKKMHPEMRKMWEDYFDKCFKEYDKHLRPWVGLTEEEIKECFKITPDLFLPWHIYTRIEAKLKEKNT
jgi:hypothetical protein